MHVQSVLITQDSCQIVLKISLYRKISSILCYCSFRNSRKSLISKEYKRETCHDSSLTRLEVANVSAMKQNRFSQIVFENRSLLPVPTELLFGVKLHNEYEVVPFTRFTSERLYHVYPGLGKRVIEKPIGYKRKDLNLVIATALKKLNNENKNEFQFRISSWNFIEGIFREVLGIGTVYELYFRSRPTLRKQYNPYCQGHRFPNSESVVINNTYPRAQIEVDKRHYLTIGQSGFLQEIH